MRFMSAREGHCLRASGRYSTSLPSTTRSVDRSCVSCRPHRRTVGIEPPCTDRHEAGRYGSMERKDFWRNGLEMTRSQWLGSWAGGRQERAERWTRNGRETKPVIMPVMSSCGCLGIALISVADPVSRPLQNGLFNGLIWPKTGFASTDLPQRPRQTFFP